MLAARPPSAASFPGARGRQPRPLATPPLRSERRGQRRHRAAAAADSADGVRAQLRSLISRLSASPDAPDDPLLRAELVALLPALAAANPTPEPARSKKIDGTWVLLATVPNAAAREKKRSPLQAALAASYDFFYERVPIIAGSAVGKKGAAGFGVGAGAGAAATGARTTTTPTTAAAAPNKKPASSPPAVRARGNFQTFDVPRGIVRNRARFDLLGRVGEVNVDGTARVLSGDRLEATFLTADLRWGGFLRIPFPIGAFRPTGWVDTVYLDDDVRVSTGDKGSVFVARRARGGGGDGE